MPTTKPGIQVKTYNSEADLGFPSAFDGPVAGPVPETTWGFSENSGEAVLESWQNPDLGVPGILGIDLPTAPSVFFASDAGQDLGEDDVYFDLGLNNPLGGEVLGGTPDPSVWVWGYVLPEAVLGEDFFALSTEFGEYIETELGELIEIV